MMRPETGARPAEQARVLEECLRHVDALYRTALRMTRNPSDAEDLVQDTYLKATRSVALYHETQGPRAWLFRILTNTYIDRYRQRLREPEVLELTERQGLYELFLESRGSEAGTPKTALTEGELDDFLKRFVSDEVKAALEELPPSFRLVVILRDVEGFSYAEIAEITGVPLGTVMSRLFRGRQTLQQRLAEYAARHGHPRGQMRS